MNSSISNVGGLVAPLAAGGLLLILGWRQIFIVVAFIVVAFISVAVGMVYFLYGKKGDPAAGDRSSGRGKLVQGKASYVRAFHNRNMILVSLVMMVGGAGRGLTVIFLAQHFKNDLGLSTFMVGVAVTAMLAGGVIGPIAFGWISDRTSRKRVTQVSLVLSAIASLWLAFQGAFLPSLLTSLIFYGIVTRSRMTLTLSLVADSLPDEDRDAAFSVFPSWALPRRPSGFC